jgi:hypothetical protein
MGSLPDDDRGGGGSGGGIPGGTLPTGGQYVRIRFRFNPVVSGSMRMKIVLTPSAGVVGDIVYHGFEYEAEIYKVR